MELKTLRYTVTADGVSPNYERMAGTQYDHKKTALQFIINNEFYDEILSLIGEAKAFYRFDCYDGEGKLHMGNLNELVGISLKPYELEYWVTKFGGKLRVNLIITLTDEDVTVKEWSYEVVLFLDDLPQSDIDGSKYQSMTTLANMTAQASKNADERYSQILQLYKEVERLEDMLKNGEWVFDGEAGSEIDIRFVIDNEFDISSEHALANKVITERLDKIDTEISVLADDFKNKVYADIISNVKDEIYDKVYPIGSYYWSSEPTLPEEMFGGVWEQIKDVFVLAAGDNYNCNSTGGEVEHKLTEKEMPKHSHRFAPNVGGVDGIDFVVPTKSGGLGVSSIKKEGNAHYPGHWASGTWGTNKIGDNQAHNNMPPYIAAYCWRRIG